MRPSYYVLSHRRGTNGRGGRIHSDEGDAHRHLTPIHKKSKSCFKRVERLEGFEPPNLCLDKAALYQAELKPHLILFFYYSSMKSANPQLR